MERNGWLILRLNIVAAEAAETKRQSLIDTAMDSISLIQLKLRAGRKLTQAETTQLNSVLDYRRAERDGFNHGTRSQLA
ncbi:hypothetical protein ECZU41_54000 [Escherichia coli]|nr:hypothetical protein ECZU41_54000 [Escherichia coli]